MTVRAGHRTILDVPHLDLPAGTVHVRGPVGAGKTTLLGLAATLIAPHTGRVTVAGHDTKADAVAVRRAIGYAGHEPAIPPELPARATLHLHARAHGIPADRVERAAHALGVATLLDRRGRELSRGQRTLLDIARATLHRPSVLLLDEPYTGLDHDATQRLQHTIDDHADAGALVLIAGHHDNHRTPTRTVTLDGGRLRPEAPG